MLWLQLSALYVLVGPQGIQGLHLSDIVCFSFVLLGASENPGAPVVGCFLFFLSGLVWPRGIPGLQLSNTEGGEPRDPPKPEKSRRNKNKQYPTAAAQGSLEAKNYKQNERPTRDSRSPRIPRGPKRTNIRKYIPDSWSLRIPRVPKRTNKKNRQCPMAGARGSLE
jgi:hypothetical protein